MSIANEVGRHVTRRRVVTTGAKLVYATPVLAATFKVDALSALASDTCDCDDYPSQNPLVNPNNLASLCCDCFHCSEAGGGDYGDAWYDPSAKAEDDHAYKGDGACVYTDHYYVETINFSYCAPKCKECGGGGGVTG